MSAPHKILVLSLTRMGDIVQSIPYFRRLRKKNPTAEIHVLVEQCFADVAGFLPNIDRIITVRLEDLLPDLAHDRTGNISRAAAYYRGLIADLQAAKYSEVWNLTHTRPSMVMNYLLANKSGQGVTLDHNGLQRVNSPWLAYFFATNLARPWCSFNLVDIYANCVDGVPWDYGRSIRIDPEVYAQHVGVQLPLDEQRTRVAIHPGASQKDKQWPTEKYRAVAKLLAAHPGTDIVLIAGPADRKIAGQFADVSNLINLVGKTTPEELAGVLSQCSLLISNDSGPMHIAAAVGTPVLDITVGSALASETAPYGAGHMVVEPDSACFPCPPRRPCPASECAERISVETITELAEWMLGRRTTAPSAMTGSRIYRTVVDQNDGLLNLKREFTREIAERDLINDIIRLPWLEFLSDFQSELRMPNVYLNRRLLQRVEQAANSARIASGIARQLASAGRSGKYNGTIENLGLLLRENEERLYRNLSGNDILSVILTYLSIARGSLNGETLESQAAETAELYHRTARLLSGLLDSTITSEIEQYSHMFAEDFHEDHAKRS